MRWGSRCLKSQWRAWGMGRLWDGVVVPRSAGLLPTGTQPAREGSAVKPAVTAAALLLQLAVAAPVAAAPGDDPWGREPPSAEPSADPTAEPSIEPIPTAPPAGAARVSSSAGEAGGAVVLWPRVIPASDAAGTRALAARLQQTLVAWTAEALPGAPLDVRPEPQRVCPRSGCLGLSVGVLLVHHEDRTCAVVAAVSPPGVSEQRLLPWAGQVALKDGESIAFRAPAESHVIIRDFLPCDGLDAHLAGGREAVIQAVQEAAR